jgi:hypothetical protein
MIFRAEDRCKFCANYLGDRKCKAFSDTIPDEIWSGDVAHDDPFPGDNGIRYESKHLQFPDAETFLSGDY